MIYRSNPAIERFGPCGRLAREKLVNVLETK
jgi:hypothetical protein